MTSAAGRHVQLGFPRWVLLAAEGIGPPNLDLNARTHDHRAFAGQAEVLGGVGVT